MSKFAKYSTIELKTPTSLLGISDQGGYVTEWKVKNPIGEWVDLLYLGSELKRTGIPILFPYYGPSTSGMGQHGFGRNLKWHLIDQSATSCILEITETDLDLATKLLYPYQFQTQIKLRLLENTFEYTLEVKNTGMTPLPIAPGLHPYWAISHQKKVAAKLENQPEFNAAEIDWDHNPPDIEYNFKNPVTILLPDRSIAIEDSSEKITKLVVWSQPLINIDHDFICFEPVSLPRGSFDQKPIIVEEKRDFKMTIKFTANLI